MSTLEETIKELQEEIETLKSIIQQRQNANTDFIDIYLELEAAEMELNFYKARQSNVLQPTT